MRPDCSPIAFAWLITSSSTTDCTRRWKSMYFLDIEFILNFLFLSTTGWTRRCFYQQRLYKKMEIYLFSSEGLIYIEFILKFFVFHQLRLYKKMEIDVFSAEGLVLILTLSWDFYFSSTTAVQEDGSWCIFCPELDIDIEVILKFLFYLLRLNKKMEINVILAGGSIYIWFAFKFVIFKMNH